MKVQIKGRPEFWISLNVISDAFATSLFTAGIGYYTAEISFLSASDSMRAVGLGISLGTITSLVMARMADLFGAVRLLAGVQVLQILCYAYLGFAPKNAGSIFGCILLLFFLGRLVSPLRGTLPPLFLSRERLLEFKAKLRTMTLTVVFLGAITVSLGAMAQLRMELLIACSGIVAYSLCAASTFRLSAVPDIEREMKKPSTIWKALSFNDWKLWLALLVSFSVVAVSSSIAPYAISLWGNKASWLLGFSSIIGILINRAIHKMISNTDGVFNKSTNRARIAIAIGIGISAFLILSTAILFSIALIPFFLVMVIVIVLVHTGQTIATVVAWDAQYNAGSDDNRALTVAIFSLSSSFGAGLAQLFAANIYGVINR